MKRIRNKAENIKGVFKPIVITFDFTQDKMINFTQL